MPLYSLDTATKVCVKTIIDQSYGFSVVFNFVVRRYKQKTWKIFYSTDLNEFTVYVVFVLEHISSTAFFQMYM